MRENLLDKSPALYLHGVNVMVMKIFLIDDGYNYDKSNHDDNGDKW